MARGAGWLEVPDAELFLHPQVQSSLLWGAFSRRKTPPTRTWTGESPIHFRMRRTLTQIEWEKVRVGGEVGYKDRLAGRGLVGYLESC